MTDVFKLIEANGLTLHGDIEHFAALVAAAEREACAKVADEYIEGCEGTNFGVGKAILARGQA
jgi:hypothetical protein